MKNCPHMRMTFLEEEDLVALYYLNASDIWSDKSCGLWWEEHYKEGDYSICFSNLTNCENLFASFTLTLMVHVYYLLHTVYHQCQHKTGKQVHGVKLKKKPNSGIWSFHWSKVLYTLLLQPMVLQYSNDAVINKKFESDEFAADNLLAFLFFILIFNTVEEG